MIASTQLHWDSLQAEACHSSYFDLRLLLVPYFILVLLDYIHYAEKIRETSNINLILIILGAEEQNGRIWAHI